VNYSEAAIDLFYFVSWALAVVALAGLLLGLTLVKKLRRPGDVDDRGELE
jgi:hypothetical protein